MQNDKDSDRTSLSTVRDLTGEHLPLLRQIKQQSLEVIWEKYGVSENHLNVYVHYQPSFYHLHIHFEHVERNKQSNGKREIPLDQIIANLEIASDFYQRTTLTYVLGEQSPLYKVIDASRPKKEEQKVEIVEEKTEEAKEDVEEKTEWKIIILNFSKNIHFLGRFFAFLNFFLKK